MSVSLKVKNGRGTLTLLAPLLGRANLRRIHAGIVLSVLAQMTLAAIPLIQQRIVDDCIVTDQRSLTCKNASTGTCSTSTRGPVADSVPVMSCRGRPATSP